MVDMKGNQISNPGLIFLLREKANQRSKDLIREGASLKLEITALEKERCHMHTLLCDLVYYLEQDAKYNTDRINSVVSSSMKVAFPEELDLSDNSHDIPSKGILKKCPVVDKLNLGMLLMTV